MNTYSVFSLSTFLLISSLNASSPQSQSSIAGRGAIIGNPVLPVRAYQPGKFAWQSSQLLAASSAQSTPGATTISPSLNAPIITATSDNTSASSSSSQTLSPVKLTNKLLAGSILPAVLLNKMNGTDQTVLSYLRKHNPQQHLITDTVEAQQILASVATNFEKRKDTPEKVQDVLEFMSLVDTHKIKMDQAARRALRTYLCEYENKQEKDLLESCEQKVEQLKADYDKQIKSMQKTEIARHNTYQGDSDNEEMVREYKPTDQLMAFKIAELVTKIKPNKQ